jgi:hypothetical protein
LLAGAGAGAAASGGGATTSACGAAGFAGSAINLPPGVAWHALTAHPPCQPVLQAMLYPVLQPVLQYPWLYPHDRRARQQRPASARLASKVTAIAASIPVTMISFRLIWFPSLHSEFRIRQVPCGAQSRERFTQQIRLQPKVNSSTLQMWIRGGTHDIPPHLSCVSSDKRLSRAVRHRGFGTS